VGGELGTHRREVKLTRASQGNMKERNCSEGMHMRTHAHTHTIPIMIGENPKLYYSSLMWSCSSPIECLSRCWIGEGSPDMVGNGEIKYPGWTKTSTTALWRRGTFKGQGKKP